LATGTAAVRFGAERVAFLAGAASAALVSGVLLSVAVVSGVAGAISVAGAVSVAGGAVSGAGWVVGSVGAGRTSCVMPAVDVSARAAAIADKALVRA
jgi:hypothetical protein